MKTISFFISSTFRDMDFERDCLNNIVAPKLQEHYLRYGYHVRFFDLRWGVTANDKEQVEEREKKILRTCFDAIDDCKPFFIALLGHRYGWIPEKNICLSSEKLQENVFKQIGIDYPSVTAMEIAYGIFEKQNYSRSLVFIRNKSSYKNIKDLDPYVEHEIKVVKFAERLKEEITRRFTENNCESHVIPYYANLSEPSMSISKVVTLFEEEIRKCVDEYIKIDRYSELNTYDILSERALLHYVCPQSYTVIVEKVLQGESAIIYGDEGFGKTSLSFDVSNELKRRGNVVLYHTVGYSDVSYDPHEMIWKWNCQFNTNKVFGGKKITKLDSIEKEWARLHYLNSVIPRQFTIIIDSIDRMQDNFCSSNLLTALPSNIQFVILSKKKLPNWESLLKIKIFKLGGINESEALCLIKEKCKFYGKTLSPPVVNKIILNRGSESHCYSPFDLLTILEFLLGMNADDFKQIRNSDGCSEEDKINNYMISSIEGLPFKLDGMYNQIVKNIEERYGTKSIIPLKVLSLSRNGLDEEKLHQILKTDFDLLQFHYVRQSLHQSLTDNFASKSWYFKQDTVRKTLINYESPSLHSNEYYLKIMSETPCLDEERIYYAILIQNNVALLQYIVTYDDETIANELVKARYERSLSHILECLTSCFTNDAELVEKIFRLLIFKLVSKLFLLSLDKQLQDEIKYWSSILEELDNRHPIKKERILFLKARSNEMLGDAYKANNDLKNAQNCFRQAACYHHLLDMKSEEEICRMKLLNVLMQ